MLVFLDPLLTILLTVHWRNFWPLLTRTTLFLLECRGWYRLGLMVCMVLLKSLPLLVQRCPSPKWRMQR